MKLLRILTAVLSAGAGTFFFSTLQPPVSWMVATVFGVFACYALTTHTRKVKPPIVRLKGLTWTREDFCRGWLITGDTGSGKTRSGITPLLYQVFQNEPRWGGLCIDDKGVYWETLSEMAAHFGRHSRPSSHLCR